MSAYFHNQSVKEGHIEYALVNNDKYTILRSKGNKSLNKNLPPRPPLVKSFELSNKINECNPYKEINEIIKDTVGDLRPMSSLLSLYVILTHCYELFPKIPLLWIHFSNSNIKTTIEDLFLSMCFNGISISSKLNREQLFHLIEKYSYTFIYTNLSNSNQIKYPFLTDHKIAKDRYELGENYEEVSTFCPKIVLSNQNCSHQGYILPITIRRCKTNQFKTATNMIGDMRYNLVQLIYENDKILTDIYGDLKRTLTEINEVFLPLLSIAKLFLDKKLLDNDEYIDIQSGLTQLSLSDKLILNPDDELILCLHDFFKKEKYNWPISNLVPYDVLCGHINATSTFNHKLGPRALSQFLNKNDLVIESKKGTRSVDDHEFQLYGNTQPMCVKINKYKLEKRFKELSR